MAQNEQDSLHVLEHLMNEFFNTTTSNVRKHDIETQLSAFNNQRDAWKLCIYFLNHTSSQYVSMYALSTIESVINRQWISLEWEQRTEIKTAIHSYLVNNNTGCPNFLRNKVAKLLVDIARQDWPHFYPEFMTVILQFLQSDQDQLLGLVLLHTTSEEMMSNRIEMSTARKEQLHCLLTQHIPEIFQLLTSILETVASKPKHRVTATPPPSPTHPEAAPPPQLAAAATVAQFRPDTKEINNELLATIQHLFAWVDLALVTPQLLRGVFHFTNAQDDDELCVLAMSTINELLYRKCAPPGSQNLFIELYHYAVQLLRDVICPTADRFETIGSEFIDKLTEFLCLLVTQHLWRLETDNRFSALDFLSLLFQCTFQQTTADTYLGCLDVWRSFMKQLKPENAFKYLEALLSLVKEALIKMQFVHNQSQLDELDYEIVDDDGETEWQHFLKESIEIIALVADFNPEAVFNLVWSPWRTANDLFHMIEKAVDGSNRQLKLSSDETQRLHCILRDLSTLTQTLARLSSYFRDSDSSEENRYIDLLMTELLKTTLYATRIRFDRLQIPNRKLIDDFIETHAQILAGLKTCCLWLVINKRESNTHQISDIVTATTSILLNGAEEPSKLSLSAAHLLLCLTNITFSPNLITLPPIVELLRVAPMLRYQDEHTLNVLYQSMCNMLVRPWGDLNDADRNHRTLLIRMFFDTLTKHFRDLTVHTNEIIVRQVTLTTLPHLSHMIEYCKHHSTASKKLLHFGIQSTIQHALSLFPRFANSAEISSVILELFLIVLEVLQQQLGLEFTKMAVQVFLDVAVSEHQSQQLTSLDKLLRILQLVVEGPGQTYKSFLPDIVSLCMDHIYPLIAFQPNPNPDVIIALLTLLHSIMLHRWQYFYTSQVRLGYSPGASDSTHVPETESLHNQQQLLSILQAFGQALLQPDLNIFRLSLASLEHLNTKWKLYHKQLFKQHVLNHFLTVLFQTLLHKTHALLTDDIIIAVYNLVSVDFDAFYQTFLMQFLHDMNGLDQRQKETLQANFRRDTDMPTFVQNVNRFVNDMRCYRICNANLTSDT